MSYLTAIDGSRTCEVEGLYSNSNIRLKDLARVASHVIEGEGVGFPYLLWDLIVDRPTYVWCADSTYVPIQCGFLYLVDVLGWYRRYVLAWALSNTLEGRFCLEAVDQVLASDQAQMFNTDQGAQFTGTAFTGRLAEAKIQVSMDERGRGADSACCSGRTMERLLDIGANATVADRRHEEVITSEAEEVGSQLACR